MRKTFMFAMALGLLTAIALLPVAGQQPQSGAQPPASGRGGGGGGRGFTGLPPVGNNEPVARIPVGFTSILNGKDLTGWHISRTNHHGTTPDFHMMHDGILVATQNPFGKGGILLTDKRYKNVEVYMEIKPDWGCDGGLFLRSNEAGDAYQVTLDYLPGGSMGGIYGEGLKDVVWMPPNLTPEQREAAQARFTENWQKAWKREEWNAVRARITGNPPHVSAWINEVPVLDWQDTANHAADGAGDGMIAIQSHMGNRWVPGGFWRWRVIAVKELP
jgi:hypothetical protein